VAENGRREGRGSKPPAFPRPAGPRRADQLTPCVLPGRPAAKTRIPRRHRLTLDLKGGRPIPQWEAIRGNDIPMGPIEDSGAAWFFSDRGGV
jgi:hypothetical protein